MKRRARSVTIPWDVYLRYARAEELPEVCLDLRIMITDVQAKRVLPTSIETRTMPTSLKLAFDGGCQLTDSEKAR